MSGFKTINIPVPIVTVESFPKDARVPKFCRIKAEKALFPYVVPLEVDTSPIKPSPRTPRKRSSTLQSDGSPRLGLKDRRSLVESKISSKGSSRGREKDQNGYYPENLQHVLKTHLDKFDKVETVSNCSSCDETMAEQRSVDGEGQWTKPSLKHYKQRAKMFSDKYRLSYRRHTDGHGDFSRIACQNAVLMQKVHEDCEQCFSMVRCLVDPSRVNFSPRRENKRILNDTLASFNKRRFRSVASDPGFGGAEAGNLAELLSPIPSSRGPPPGVLRSASLPAGGGILNTKPKLKGLPRRKSVSLIDGHQEATQPEIAMPQFRRRVAHGRRSEQARSVIQSTPFQAFGY